MKQVLLLQLDGKLPNLALMRLAAHHRAQGDAVTLRRAANVASVQRQLGEPGVGPRRYEPRNLRLQAPSLLAQVDEGGRAE